VSVELTLLFDVVSFCVTVVSSVSFTFWEAVLDGLIGEVSVELDYVVETVVF